MKAKTAQKQQKNSKEKKPEGMSSVQPHQVIRTKAMRCTKVFIPPQEVNQSMAKNVAPARDGTRQYDEYLKFLMDLDANELFIPDILNSDLLQVYRDETLEDDSVIGDDSGANYMSSCSTNAAIIENFNAYDSLHEPNAALELKRSVQHPGAAEPPSTLPIGSRSPATFTTAIAAATVHHRTCITFDGVCVFASHHRRQILPFSGDLSFSGELRFVPKLSGSEIYMIRFFTIIWDELQSDSAGPAPLSWSEFGIQRL
ncbi:hypothetical protein HHK36_025426 [Tetracentron sinense]|uniref:Uncharacterized protein n=1 Tax=Tetracentron sinense TaxID=13715 RepID=A0A834YN57_TETSI|nr:hypothetical protein HHK36_025426 [Tetracentron sinense]